MKDSNEPTYQLTCTKSQLRLINSALEAWFRTHMGQFWDYADEVVEQEYLYLPPIGDNTRDDVFTEIIERRDAAREMFDAAYKRLTGWPKIRRQSEDDRRAVDIWHTIRYQLWLDRPEPKPHDTVDSWKCAPMSDDPAVRVGRVEADG